VGQQAAWSGLGEGGAVRAAELVPAFSLERLSRAPTRTSEPAIRAHLGL
jgi:hypothetical protein